MIDWFQSLTSTTGFVPRRQCGDWTPGWITVHAGSDVLIWLAYLSIPLVLLAVARHAAVRPFRPMIGLFAAFILACGTTHLIEAVIFEHPIYRLGGVVKVLTAVVSWATVLALIPAVPRLLPLLDQLTTTPTAEPGPDPDAVKPAGLVYSLAILIALLAVLIRYAMHPVLGEYAPYMVSLLATVFVAWYGGFGPGLVTLLLSGVATVYLFVPPRGAFDLDDLSKQFGLGMFLFTGLGVLVLGGLQRETRRRLHGKVLQLWSAREEVTAEKRKADETLAALDAFVRNAPYGIAYFDPDLRYIRVNDTFASANGVPVDEHIGRVLTDVLPDFPPDLVANFHRVLDTGEPLTRHIVRGPETVWELTAFPVPLTDSRHGLGVIGVDVTDRQRHEEQLRQSEARFRQLAEVMPQIVWVARGDGHREYYNSRWYEYTGLTVEQSAGREGWVDALHPDDREHRPGGVAALGRNRQPVPDRIPVPGPARRLPLVPRPGRGGAGRIRADRPLAGHVYRHRPAGAGGRRPPRGPAVRRVGAALPVLPPGGDRRGREHHQRERVVAAVRGGQRRPAGLRLADRQLLRRQPAG